MTSIVVKDVRVGGYPFGKEALLTQLGVVVTLTHAQFFEYLHFGWVEGLPFEMFGMPVYIETAMFETLEELQEFHLTYLF